jgi:hypothetical protein
LSSQLGGKERHTDTQPTANPDHHSKEAPQGRSTAVRVQTVAIYLCTARAVQRTAAGSNTDTAGAAAVHTAPSPPQQCKQHSTEAFSVLMPKPLTCTVVAPQSRRKSAGLLRGLTMHRTSYPSSRALRTTWRPKVPVPPTTRMEFLGTAVPPTAAAAAADPDCCALIRCTLRLRLLRTARCKARANSTAATEDHTELRVRASCLNVTYSDYVFVFIVQSSRAWQGCLRASDATVPSQSHCLWTQTSSAPGAKLGARKPPLHRLGAFATDRPCIAVCI